MSDVFISYVRENARFVGFLKQILEKNGVRVWLDKDNLNPGVRWRQAIENAIRQGTYFLSIHSKQRESRSVSYANEELVVAIEEIRKRPVSKPWFIPIKIDDCEIEARPIGGGETLLDLNICDLRDWNVNMRRLLETLGVADPVLDDGVPLAAGLPSFVRLSGGFIRYEHVDAMPVMFQGMEFRVDAGWCQRTQDDKIIAYIETVAPLAPWQKFNRDLGLSGVHALSDEREISTDEARPTHFNSQQETVIPRGSSAIDLHTGREIIVPIDLTFRSEFEAAGHIVDWHFVGRFHATLQSVGLPVPPTQMHGAFRLDFTEDPDRNVDRAGTA